MSRQIEPGKRLSKFERQYLRDRDIDPDEFEQSEPVDEVETDDEGGILSDGTNVARAGQLPTDLGHPPKPSSETDPARAQGGDSALDDEGYSDWDAKALKAEIARRNEDRDEDSQIVPEGSGTEGRLRKGDLVAALEADDAANAGDDE